MASRFRFRLEPLLTLRRTRRDALRSEFSRRTRVVNGIVGQIEEIHRSIARGVQDARSMLTGGAIDLSAVRTTRHESVRLQGDLFKAEQALDAARDEAEKARKELLRASRELEVIERLKEKALDRHRQAMGREDQVIMDEIGMQMHWRAAHSTARASGSR